MFTSGYENSKVFKVFALVVARLAPPKVLSDNLNVTPVQFVNLATCKLGLS